MNLAKQFWSIIRQRVVPYDEAAPVDFPKIIEQLQTLSTPAQLTFLYKYIQGITPSMATEVIKYAGAISPLTVCKTYELCNNKAVSRRGLLGVGEPVSGMVRTKHPAAKQSRGNTNKWDRPPMGGKVSATEDLSHIGSRTSKP